MYVKKSKYSRAVDNDIDIFQIQVNGKNIALGNGSLEITKKNQDISIIVEKDQAIINFIPIKIDKNVAKCEVTLKIGPELITKEPIQISIQKGEESRIILIYNNQ